MIDDMTKMIKEKLLQELIDKMSDAGGDRIKPKTVGVSVEAPNEAKLAEGLDKAKDLVTAGPEADQEHEPMSDTQPSEEDDEQRLLELLNDDEK